jgi:putative cardiolipin synthase
LNPGAFADTAATRLGRATELAAQGHGGLTGVLALAEGREAFATRMLLAEAAERSLDVQYYIWHADLTGKFLLEALRQAADRGVRVRLLLDDNSTQGLDPILAALDSHPNIEVRLFNPFLQRDWRWLGYLTDFGRLNRRMHNKSFTVDNQVTVVGGRNIGDEYFDAGQEVSFVDLDVLVRGRGAAGVRRLRSLLGQRLGLPGGFTTACRRSRALDRLAHAAAHCAATLQRGPTSRHWVDLPLSSVDRG